MNQPLVLSFFHQAYYTRETAKGGKMKKLTIRDVAEDPVETNTGASIVSTQGGNIVLSDGSMVAPEVLGGTVNEDQTISVTDKDGNLKTLPNTGTAESILSTIGGMLLTAVGYFYKKKLF